MIMMMIVMIIMMIVFIHLYKPMFVMIVLSQSALESFSMSIR